MNTQQAQRSTGIILLDDRHRRYSISVFDEQYGRISAVVSRCRYATARLQGVFVEYEILHDAYGYQLRNMEPILLPNYRNYLQLLHTHQLIELVRHCVPQEAPSQEIYDLLRSVIEYQHLVADDRVAKAVLGRLFYLTGLYEPFEKYIDQLVQLTFEQLVHHDFAHASAAQLDAMVYTCIARHPFAHTFKTVRLLGGINDD